MTKELLTVELDNGTYINENSRCPKCNGNTLERSGEDLHCWSCGSTFYSKPHDKVSATRGRKTRMTREEILGRHKFYEDNKQAILSDVSAIGVAATYKKWNIPPGSFYQLLRRWKDETAGRARGQRTVVAIILPPLPPFSNDWDPKVQEKWFDIYEELASKLPVKLEQSPQGGS